MPFLETDYLPLAVTSLTAVNNVEFNQPVSAREDTQNGVITMFGSRGIYSYGKAFEQNVVIIRTQRVV